MGIVITRETGLIGLAFALCLLTVLMVYLFIPKEDQTRLFFIFRNTLAVVSVVTAVASMVIVAVVK